MIVEGESRPEQSVASIPDATTPSAAQWTLAWQDDVSFMGPSRARVLFAAIHGCPKVVCARIDTRRIYVIVLDEVTHVG